MLKPKLLLVLFLCFSPALGKVIISTPQAGSYIDRSLLTVSGVTDEDCDIDLSLYDSISKQSISIGSFTPDSNGFWSANIDFSSVNGSSVYLIASTILDKANVLVYLKNSLLIDLSILEGGLDFKRGELIVFKGEVIAVNGSASIEEVSLIINDSVSIIQRDLDKVGESYEYSYLIPNNARLGSWSFLVNHSSNDYLVTSDVGSFNVLPTNVSINLLSDHTVNLGSNEVRVNVYYPSGGSFNGEVSVLITPPIGDSFSVQLNQLGDYFAKDLLFNYPGEWFLSFNAEEFGNTGCLNTSVIVSSEISVEVIDSSLFLGDDLSFLVSVQPLTNVSFNVSGIPASISNVILEGGYYRVFLNVSLPPGSYDFTVSVDDGLGNVGFANGILVINDLVLVSCVKGSCASSEPVILNESVSFINGSISLSDGSIIDADIELFVNGFRQELPVDDFGLFSSDLAVSDGFILIIARYNGLLRTNSFYIQEEAVSEDPEIIYETSIIERFANVTIEFPGLVELVQGENLSLPINLFNHGSSSVNVSFSSIGLPSWISVPSSVTVPVNSSVSEWLFINPFNVSGDVYSFRVSGDVNGSVFSDNLVVIVEDEFSYDFVDGELIVESVSFDLNNTGVVIKVVNSDSVDREFVVNSSGNLSSHVVSAFNDDEVFIPFSNVSSDFSIMTGDSVVFNMGSEAVNDVMTVDSVTGDFFASGGCAISFSLIIGYSVFILFVFSWLYWPTITKFVKKTYKKFKK